MEAAVSSLGAFEGVDSSAGDIFEADCDESVTTVVLGTGELSGTIGRSLADGN